MLSDELANLIILSQTDRQRLDFLELLSELIKCTYPPGGYRTILAYTAPGHEIRVNHYSNPGVLYPGSNTSTGLTGGQNSVA